MQNTNTEELFNQTDEPQAEVLPEANENDTSASSADSHKDTEVTTIEDRSVSSAGFNAGTDTSSGTQMTDDEISKLMSDIGIDEKLITETLNAPEPVAEGRALESADGMTFEEYEKYRVVENKSPLYHNALAITDHDIRAALCHCLTPAFLRDLVIYPEIKVSAKGRVTSRNGHVVNARAGELFANIFGEVIRYNSTSRSWWIYDGNVWTDESGSEIVNKFADHISKQIDTNFIERYADSKWGKTVTFKDPATGTIITAGRALSDFTGWLSSSGHLSAMVSAAANSLLIAFSDGEAKHNVAGSPIMYFDTPETNDLFNMQNGTYSIKYRRFMPHSPRDFITRLANVAYDENAECPRWDRFMDEIFDGDKNKQSYVQQIYYTALACKLVEKMFIFYGPKSRNGKSTTVETMTDLFGSYSTTIRPAVLMAAGRNNGEAASPALYSLRGARLITLSETDEKMVWDSSLLKSITGNTTITARLLHENGARFRVQGRLVLDSNYLPASGGDYTLFKSGRLNVLTFDHYFDDAHADPDLKDKLHAEFPGILNWILKGRGAFEAAGNKIVPPECVETANREYEEDEDKIGQFFDECVVETKNKPDSSLSNLRLTARIDRSDHRDELIECNDGNCTELMLIWKAYCGWCRDTGIGALGRTKFARKVLPRYDYHKEQLTVSYSDGIAITGSIRVRSLVLGVELNEKGLDYLDRQLGRSSTPID